MALRPAATVTLRSHKLAWRCNLQVVMAPVFGVLVTQRVARSRCWREYGASAACSY